MNYPRKGYLVTPFMDVYQANIQSYVSLDKLKLIVMVREDLQNKETIGDTWYPTASMRTLKYLLADYSKKKEGCTNWILLDNSYIPM